VQETAFTKVIDLGKVGAGIIKRKPPASIVSVEGELSREPGSDLKLKQSESEQQNG